MSQVRLLVQIVLVIVAPVIQVYIYRDIELEKLGQPGYIRYWDDVAKVPYLYNAAKQEWISYDVKVSLECKMKYMCDQGLGGAMSWGALSR